MTRPAIACCDVAYGGSAAAAACAVIDGWEAGRAERLLVQFSAATPERYEPGAFYKREMPLLLKLIAELGQGVKLGEGMRPEDGMGAIVIDGYAWLSIDAAPGLGARLFTALGGKVPVIGVAKTRYRGDTWSVPVLRGESRRPLFVTAAGMDADEAARHVGRMHGDHRIPTILALVDAEARAGLTRGA